MWDQQSLQFTLYAMATMVDDARDLDHTQMVDDKKMSDSAGGVDQPMIRSTAIKQVGW